MERLDPYQARARELAIAAGVDPDGRIPMEGKPGRTMPNWCSYLDWHAIKREMHDGSY